MSWSPDRGLSLSGGGGLARGGADLVLYFGSRAMLAQSRCLDEVRQAFPGAMLFGCSAGGQIAGDDISDDALSAVAIKFDHTRFRAAEAHIADAEQSRDRGLALGRELAAPDLAGVLVLSDGLNVNGSELVAGLVGALGRDVPICGGLAGDGAAFERTLVGLGGDAQSHVVAAIGLYGDRIRVGYGSAGGWEVFGPSRNVTRSRGNVLMELDGQPALDLYERYLGPEDLRGLPGTALRFPLLIRNPECTRQELVRTVLAIDRTQRTMTFAGDVPKGWTAQLMRSSFDRLADGAASAGAQARAMMDAPGAGDPENGVAILISCIGRRLMMGQRIVDEIEAANANLPPGLAKLGFYSYGEISPHAATGFCELHNQTMTVMTLSETAA